MKKILPAIIIILIIFLSGCITISNPLDNDENEPDPYNPDDEIITDDPGNQEDNIPQTTEIITSNPAPSHTWYWIYGKNSGYVSQTFHSSFSYTITKVEINLIAEDNCEDIIVEIQKVSNDKPNTVCVTSGILDKNLIKTGWNTIDIVDAQLEGQTRYALVIGSPDQQDVGPIKITATKGEKYNNGEAFYGNGFDFNSWYPRIGEDYLFKIIGRY